MLTGIPRLQVVYRKDGQTPSVADRCLSRKARCFHEAELLYPGASTKNAQHVRHISVLLSFFIIHSLVKIFGMLESCNNVLRDDNIQYGGYTCLISAPYIATTTRTVHPIIKNIHKACSKASK